MIIEILRSTWSIFLGFGFLMLGNGLQGTLTGWRAIYEGFDTITTGLIMTSYFIGYLAGPIITPKLVKNVGHIRVFAALASMASAAILIQILFISPFIWFGMRLLTGFCFAGTYVIVESWLNARSDNLNRGRVLSIYMVIAYLSLAGGQWLLNAADPAHFSLFLVASILLSLALVPVLISRVKAPEIEYQQKIGISQLFSCASTGSATIFLISIAHGAIFGMGAVYAAKVGMTIAETVLFMSSFILFGALIQWPVGWLSDKMDRRYMILGVAMLSTVLCLLLLFMDLSQMGFLIVFGLMGGISLSIYPLAVAQTHDQLQPEQMVGASSTIALIYGFGSILAPISIGLIMDYIGLHGFFIYLSLAHLLIVLVLFYFILKNSPVADEDLTQYQVVPPRCTILALETIAHEAEESQVHENENS
jgi:MFS family permease